MHNFKITRIFLHTLVSAALLLPSAAFVSCSDNEKPADSYDVYDISDGGSQPDTDSSESADDKPDMFDVSPIVEAYRSGDSSKLSQLEKDILDKAANVLDEIITDDMDDYAKELAVHDYLIINCTYDEGELKAIPQPSENCDNPYGTLYNGQAICKGYTTTFRMFMGMLGIPCGTVHASDTDGDEHAWNTVKLDGSWYYVDCTWDDPVPDYDGRLVEHTYFNCSRELMEQRHILPDGTPETDSIKYSYNNQSAVNISELSQMYDAIESAADNKADSAVLVFDDSMGLEFSTHKDLLENPDFQNEIAKIDGGGKYIITRYQIAETEIGKALIISYMLV